MTAKRAYFYGKVGTLQFIEVFQAVIGFKSSPVGSSEGKKKLLKAVYRKFLLKKVFPLTKESLIEPAQIRLLSSKAATVHMSTVMTLRLFLGLWKMDGIFLWQHTHQTCRV